MLVLQLPNQTPGHTNVAVVINDPAKDVSPHD
jgi:hypothetical protein